MNTKINIHIQLLAILLALFSLPAAAGKNGKVYAASQCAPSDYSVLRAIRYHGGAAYNSYDRAKWLTCPIVKDQFSTKNISIKVSVIDNNYAAGDPKVRCGIVNTFPEGNVYRTAWAYSKPGSSASVQELTIRLSNILYYGPVSLLCQVPGYHHASTRDIRYSSVLSYTAIEEN